MEQGGSASALVTGLRCRCPRCGRGRLFQGFLTVAPRCDSCGLDLAQADSGDGPAVFVVFVVGAVVTAAALIVETQFMPPLWLHLLLWGPLIIGGSLGLLRPFKGALIALQYRHRAGDAGSHTFDSHDESNG